MLHGREPSDLAGNSLGSGDTLGLAQGPGPGAALGFVVTLWPFARPAAMPVFGVLYLSNALAAPEPLQYSAADMEGSCGGRSSGSLASPETKYLSVLHRSRRGPRARGGRI